MKKCSTAIHKHCASLEATRGQDHARVDIERRKISATPAPTLITPPEGASALLLGHGVGTQGYVCLPKDTGASWTKQALVPYSADYCFFRRGEQQ